MPFLKLYGMSSCDLWDDFKFRATYTIVQPRLYSKVWPMLSIFDSNKQKTPLEISVVFDRWGAVL
jgi:hypothetical protein